MDFVSGGAVVRIDVGALELGQVMRASFGERVASGSSDLVLDATVTGDLEIARTQSFLRLRGRVGTVATMVCSRCLTTIRRPLEAVLDEEFPIGADDDEAGETRELGLSAGPTPVLDVSEVVRQQLLLTTPMAPLCRPDCRGICPTCGANRNEADCGHDVTSVDPRWEPLARLKITERE